MLLLLLLVHSGLAATPMPLTGIIGYVDHPLTNLEGQSTPTGTIIDGTNTNRIFVPFESGFRAGALERLFDCSGMGLEDLPGGLDTMTAAKIVEYECEKTGEEVQFLDACGGHVTAPNGGSIYHYHELLTCLYEPDATTGHSTRIGTANDGNGIYGKYDHGGVLPTDLDACGGHFGVPPDSTTGAVEYYYMMQDQPPFTLGCFGPATMEECRDLYDTCGDDATPVTTYEDGTYLYDLNCPCYGPDGRNYVDPEAPAVTPAPTPEPTPEPTRSPTMAQPTPAHDDPVTPAVGCSGSGDAWNNLCRPPTATLEQAYCVYSAACHCSKGYVCSDSLEAGQCGTRWIGGAAGAVCVAAPTTSAPETDGDDEEEDADYDAEGASSSPGKSRLSWTAVAGVSGGAGLLVAAAVAAVVVRRRRRTSPSVDKVWVQSEELRQASADAVVTVDVENGTAGRWIEHKTDAGESYFFNPLTQMTSWSRPE